ncbi:MAG TPA: AAA family ATPase [Candidatus Saccharimonadales bacterium]|nr:AAA family ATPase [Candidatus Saccharimonadales bacterium]
MQQNLVVLRGLPGSGKTVLANNLANYFDLNVFDPDQIDKSKSDFLDFINSLSEELPLRRKMYRYLLSQVNTDLNSGKSVIWSQPWRKIDRLVLTIKNIQHYLKPIIQYDEMPIYTLKNELAFNVVVIELNISTEESRNRVSKRYIEGNHTWDGSNLELFNSSFEDYNLPFDYINIDANKKPSLIAKEAIKFLCTNTKTLPHSKNTITISE